MDSKITHIEYEEILKWTKKLVYKDWRFLRKNVLYSNWVKDNQNKWVNKLTIKDYLSEFISDSFIYFIGVFISGLILMFTELSGYYSLLGGGIFYSIYIKTWYKNDTDRLVELLKKYYYPLKFESLETDYLDSLEGFKIIDNNFKETSGEHQFDMLFLGHDSVVGMVKKIFQIMEKNDLARQVELNNIWK